MENLIIATYFIVLVILTALSVAYYKLRDRVEDAEHTVKCLEIKLTNIEFNFYSYKYNGEYLIDDELFKGKVAYVEGFADDLKVRLESVALPEPQKIHYFSVREFEHNIKKNFIKQNK